MFKTEKTVLLLKTIATIAGFATILWSLGLPSLRFADAANITDVSDTLSDSAPSASADHTITFVTPSGVANGETIIIDLSEGFTNGAGVDFSDIDIATTSDFTVAANCAGSERVSAAFVGLVLTFTFCAGDGGSIPAGGTTTIQIGDNATGGAANQQLVNSASEGSFEIGFTVGSQDSGWTRVVILENVLVTAAVDTIFTFTVAGLGGGQTVNGVVTTGTTSSTSIPFGTLQDGVSTTTGQSLTVVTNAANGYSVTVQLDQPLLSSTGADIDGFVEGSYTNTPTAWASPVDIVGSENTYGHWGITSDDATTTRSAPDEFGNAEFASASTSPRVVMSHNGPANGTGTGVGLTRVGYKVEISALQEAGDDYETTLTYVATPTF